MYNTKSDAVTASGISENIFDTLLGGGYSNASLFFFESISPVSFRIAAPVGITFDNNTFEREVGWVCGDIYFGIYYDGNSGNYRLYGANDTPPIQ